MSFVGRRNSTRFLHILEIYRYRSTCLVLMLAFSKIKWLKKRKVKRKRKAKWTGYKLVVCLILLLLLGFCFDDDEMDVYQIRVNLVNEFSQHLPTFTLALRDSSMCFNPQILEKKNIVVVRHYQNQPMKGWPYFSKFPIPVQILSFFFTFSP